MVKRNLLFVSLALLTSASLPAAVVNVDVFTDTQQQVATSGGGIAAAGAAGGARHVTATLVGGSPAPAVNINNFGGTGLVDRLVFNNDLGVNANFRLLYDGGTDTDNDLGLNLNLSDNGLNTLLRLVLASDLQIVGGLVVNLYGPALTDVRSVTVTVPDTNSALVNLDIPFSSFSVDNDVDLTSVRAIEVNLSGTQSLDFSIDFIAADVSDVPEPATVLLLGGALTGLALIRRRS